MAEDWYLHIRLDDLVLAMCQTALDSMTPIESTFSLDIQSKLDWCVLFTAIGVQSLCCINP